MTRNPIPLAAIALIAAASAVTLATPATASAATPDPGETQLVDITTSMVAATNNQNGAHPSVSADGRYVVFGSQAQDLFGGTPDTWDPPSQVYIRDTVLNTTRPLNSSGPSYGTNPVISDDGQFVVYISVDPVYPLDPDYQRAYVWSAATRTSKLVSVDYTSAPVNAAVTSVDISGSGNAVVYTTAATNVLRGDPFSEAKPRVYKVDLRTNETTLPQYDAIASADSGTISDDGRFVAFISADDHSTIPAHGTRQVYVRDTSVSAVAEPVSVDPPATAFGNGDVSEAAISGDGRSVMFSTDATNITSGSVPRTSHVWVRDRSAGITSIASFASSGVPQEASGSAISSDGRFVAYTSPTSGPSGWQVYVVDRWTAHPSLVSQSASGPGNANSFNIALSATGQFAVWSSLATSLTSDKYPVGRYHSSTHSMLRNLGATFSPLADVY